MSPRPTDAIFSPAFRIATPFGLCVGLRLAAAPAEPAVLLPLLHPRERPLADGLRGARLVEFVGGRIAARQARLSVSGEDGPTLRGTDGAPSAPGVAISIAHTRCLAVALAAADPAHPVGVDVEMLAADPGDPLLAERIVTAEEAAADRACGPVAVIARLALKEAAWKALSAVAGPVGLRDIVAVRDGIGLAVRVPRLADRWALAAHLVAVEDHALALVAVTDETGRQVAAGGAERNSAARRRSTISQPAARPNGTQMVSQTQSAGVTFTS
jgi:4'-phosphopantetheinyl transferase EntD